MKIGDTQFEDRLFLAPMAGVTDAPYRAICSQFGCGLAYTEMISAKALFYNDKKTRELLEKADEEPWPAVQIFGSDPESISFAVEYINGTDSPMIDLNMGCPATKIVRNGEGSALMKDMAKAAVLIKTAVQASRKPVTVKLRSGWDKNNINAVDFALMAQESGAAAVCVHPRTREMHYSGTADWGLIAKIKQKLDIPVIGSGDIFSADDAVRMMNATGCDAAMAARGALGNPWIFKNYIRIRSGLAAENPSLEEKKEIISRHLHLMLKYKDERLAVLEMRKFAAWYAHAETNASIFRNKVNKCISAEEIIECLGILKDHPENKNQ
ncbi:MAG: tRNA dihydrouridine synthase DusB [Clostridia bacterium]|nr:tRNA dihydrouridine synthase DusB [Clostridia bacterium]